MSLDVSALPDWDSFTFVALFEFDQPIAYRRILQTKNFTDDHGLYWNTSRLEFYPGGNGPSGVHKADRFEQVAFVKNHGSLGGYVDGMFQFSTTSDAEVSVDHLMQIFRDDGVGDNENSGGEVARMRLYHPALTAVPAPTECGVAFGGLAAGLILWRRASKQRR